MVRSRGYSYQKTVPPNLYEDLTKNYGKVGGILPWLPLKFTQASEQKRSFLSYFIPKAEPVIKVYNHLIQSLVDPNNTQPSFIETSLLQKWKQEQEKRRCKIRVVKNHVLHTKLLDEVNIYGVFIHRHLNMPSGCYSFEANNSKGITYVLKKQFGRSTDIKLQRDIQKKYEDQNWQLVYVEKYDYFVSKEYIVRQIHQVESQLVLEVTSEDNPEPVLIGQDIPSRHIIQVQKINYPYGLADLYLTDVDYYMEGNPHTIGF